jgi:hypothetical protein
MLFLHSRVSLDIVAFVIGYILTWSMNSAHQDSQEVDYTEPSEADSLQLEPNRSICCALEQKIQTSKLRGS